MKRFLYILIILAMQVVSACAGNAPHATPMPPARLTQEPVVEAEAVPKETPAAEAPADASQSPLDDLLNQWMTPGNGLCDAPGAVLLVDSPTGRYLKAAGVTSLEDPRPVRVDDRFEIGSKPRPRRGLVPSLGQKQVLIPRDFQ